MAACGVCKEHPGRPRLCTLCMRSYDVTLKGTPTTWEIIRWAARRAARAERQRHEATAKPTRRRP